MSRYGDERFSGGSAIGLARGFDAAASTTRTDDTLRFLSIRGWLHTVVGSCTWCATRQAIAMVEAEGGRRWSESKGACDGGGLCDGKMKLFLPSKPRPGETATESESVACPTCRARAYSVRVGKRSVVVCWKCNYEKASAI